MMAYIIQPLPITDNLSYLANPLLARMNEEQVLTTTTQPALHLKWLLTLLTTTTTRLDAAVAAERWILDQTGHTTPGAQFVWLALLDILGRVDTTPLTVANLIYIAAHALALYNLVFLPPRATLKQLIDATAARKAALRGTQGDVVSPYVTILDRIAQRLGPLLPR